MCVTPHWGWTRGRVRERICRDLESCPDSRASSPWCSEPDISGSRRRACLVWGSCSAPRGKGRAEHPVLVRSCRVPTEPALPWQGNLALTGRLHQDDPRGATSIPEQSQKGPASPALCTTPAALPASSRAHHHHHHHQELPWMGDTPSGPSPQPFSHISCVGDLHLPKLGPGLG